MGQYLITAPPVGSDEPTIDICFIIAYGTCEAARALNLVLYYPNFLVPARGEKLNGTKVRFKKFTGSSKLPCITSLEELLAILRARQ